MELEGLVMAYTHVGRVLVTSLQKLEEPWLRQGDPGRRGGGRCFGAGDHDPSDSLGSYAYMRVLRLTYVEIPKVGARSPKEIRAGVISVEMLSKSLLWVERQGRQWSRTSPKGPGSRCLKDAPSRRLSQDMGGETFKKEISDYFHFRRPSYFFKDK